MSLASDHMVFLRHPWLNEFERVPQKALGDLLAGYARVPPYERADAPDAARMLFGPLNSDDSARALLGPAILAWLEAQRKDPLPASRPKLQRRVREICEAFEIVALLGVGPAAVGLRRQFIKWNEWVGPMALSPARDARAEYWRTLALTQPLVADVEPSIAANGLVSLWQRICREAGTRLPRHYLSIGLLGLRRLPKMGEQSELPWLSGLAQWALAQQPSNDEFKAEWFALKPLYPRGPGQWRTLVSRILSANTFRDANVESPAWWRVDPDFGPMVRGIYKSSEAPLRSPMPQDGDRVISMLGEPFEDAEPLIESLFERHRLFVNVTGDAQYFVRTIHVLGRALIERDGDHPSSRARKAQSLAREGLRWEPHNRYLWSLWRDALLAGGALKAAELVAWENLRRDPYPDAFTQLGTLLANSLNKFSEAELLLEEAIGRFPTNAHARNQLAELLIAEDRLPEARTVVDDAFDYEAIDATTYAVRARLYSQEGRSEEALAAVESGIEFEPSDIVLKQFRQRLDRGMKLVLKSRAFITSDHQPSEKAEIAAEFDPDFSEVTRLGNMRRLRFRLEAAPPRERDVALEELRRILNEDPTFAYAELLAARQRIWEAEAGVLPPFAAAFEEALATEDRTKLEHLAKRQPRLEALVLVAQAILGDAKAAEQVERWLRSSEAGEERSVAGLRAALRPVLSVIEGGRTAAGAFREMREVVIVALHDANEATLGELLLAA